MSIDTREHLNRREQFQSRVASLVEQVRAWTAPHDWVTKIYEKKMRDGNHEGYEAPALLLQKGPTRILLDPVAYDVPGSEGLVDLYLMPTYDDMASLCFRGDDWEIHYAALSHSSEPSRLPLTEATFNQVLDSIVNHAQPSF